VTFDTSVRTHLVRLVLAVFVAAVPVLATGCSSDEGKTAPVLAAGESSTRGAPPRDMSIYPALPAVPRPAAATVSCTYVDRGEGTVAHPPSTAPTSGVVNLTLDTSAGPVPLVLDRSLAPCAVNNFVGLAERGFYTGTSCHRLSNDPGSHLYQCGDPTGTGTGGPGYTFADEYPVPAYDGQPHRPAAVVYPRGTVAMANTGVAHTNGSQFFLLLGDSLLRPNYPVFGRVADAGLPVLDAAAASGNDGTNPLGGGTPITPVTIEAVR